MNRNVIVCLLVTSTFVVGFPPEKKQVSALDLVGDWSGTSLCQVRPSPCKDEQVVFRLSHPQNSKIYIQADKIVEGKSVTMGAGDWSYDSVSQALTWEIPRGTWKLVVAGDEMNGTLVTRDNLVFRKIHLHRSK